MSKELKLIWAIAMTFLVLILLFTSIVKNEQIYQILETQAKINSTQKDIEKNTLEAITQLQKSNESTRWKLTKMGDTINDLNQSFSKDLNQLQKNLESKTNVQFAFYNTDNEFQGLLFWLQQNRIQGFRCEKNQEQGGWCMWIPN